jgi:small subunit ribosomal protein S14
MAKKSIEARQRKREALVAKFAAKRAALKEAGEWTLLDNFRKTHLKCVCATVVL